MFACGRGNGNNKLRPKKFLSSYFRTGVRLPSAPPRRKKPAPFRFRGFRKSRESSISAGSFLLFPIEARFDGAPQLRTAQESRFRKSRASFDCAAGLLLFPIEARFDGAPNPRVRGSYQGSDAPPRRKKPAPFRFRGFRKSRESSISAGSFLLFPIEARFDGAPQLRTAQESRFRKSRASFDCAAGLLLFPIEARFDGAPNPRVRGSH